MTAPLLAQSSPVCGPLDDGRVANVAYQGSVLFFDPVVEYVWDRAVLTISGPCEDIVRTFKHGEEISFDVREIVRVTDGQYTWQLRFEPKIDAGVKKDLQASRGTGEEDAVWWSYWQKGAIPAGPSVDSASFTVDRGLIVDPKSGEEKSASGKGARASVVAAGIAGGGSADSGAGGAGLAAKDQVIPDDLIVQSSLCVGFDCVNGESFGFDTIRLKENNTRIQFNDTSSGSFPTNNWQIRANSSSNGGANFLGFVDQGSSNTSESGTLVFAVEANAGANALFVDSTGRVGLGTATPVLDLHISSTNTPGMRLEQTSGGGFSAQSWDISGNETNFFIRDVTGGSRLPLRIRPGAPTSSIDISGTGRVGVGTASPGASLHVRRTDGTTQLLVEEASTTEAVRNNIQVTNNGRSQVRLTDTSADGGNSWFFGTREGAFQINEEGDGGQNDFVLSASGSITIPGTITTSGSCSGGCDRVFDPDFEVAPIDAHAASMWQNRHLPAVGPTPEDGPFNLTEKTGGMLHELEVAHIYIEQLHGTVQALEAKLGERDQEVRTLAVELAALRAAVEEIQAER